MSVSETGGPHAEEEPETTLLPQRVARMRQVAAHRLKGLTIVLDNLHDPHNISAVLRSCEIFGLHTVHIVHPKGKVSMNRGVTRGCHRWMDLVQHPGIAPCLKAVKAEGFRLYAADPAPGSRPLGDLDFSQPAALILGAEHDGLSPESIELADASFHIEMQGFTKSFNVSVAAALSLYIASGKRREALGAPSDLSPDEQARLFRRWVEEHKERRRG